VREGRWGRKEEELQGSGRRKKEGEKGLVERGAWEAKELNLNDCNIAVGG